MKQGDCCPALSLEETLNIVTLFFISPCGSSRLNGTEQSHRLDMALVRRTLTFNLCYYLWAIRMAKMCIVCVEYITTACSDGNVNNAVESVACFSN